LAGLPEKYRTPLVCCYLEGRTQEEVAQHLGAPLGTVRSWLARGREMLRKRLVRRGLRFSAAGLASTLVASAASAASDKTPTALLAATLPAALRLAAGQDIAGMIGPRAAALVQQELWDLATGRPLARFASEAGQDCVALAPDNQTAVVGGSDGVVRLVDVATGKVVRAITAHQPTDKFLERGVWRVGFGPGGETIVSWG